MQTLLAAAFSGMLAGLQGPALPQAAQPPPAGLIAGTLTSADHGRPVRRAQVRLVGSAPRSVRTVVTDAAGRFVFAGVPPGEYSLSASKTGYLDMVLGARRPGASVPGAILRLAPGHQLADVSFRIPRGGVVSGVVTDEFGDPAYNVPVRAIRLGFSNGERVAQPAGNAVTDDLGAYRIAGLMPGEYLVSAVPRDTVAAASAIAESLTSRQAEILAAARAAGNEAAMRARLEEGRAEGAASATRPPPALGYVPVFYPSAPAPSGAATLRLGVSEQVGGIDIQLHVVHTAMVSGVVTNAAGAPVAARVQLIDPAMPVANVGVLFRQARADGRFAFRGVVPGSYVVRAQATQREGPSTPLFLSAFSTVSVGEGGTADVTLALRRGVTVSGVLDLTSTTAPVDLGRLHVGLLAIPDASEWELPVMRATPDADGRFVMRGVPPARYRVAVQGLPEGLVLASAVFNERDAADYNLVVEAGRTYAGVLTFTSRTSSISGAVTDASGRPAQDSTIVLFPAERAQWVPQSRRIHVAQPDAEGRYTVRGVPAGEYRLAACAGLEPGQQFDPAFLAELVPGSVQVTLAEAEERAQDVRAR